MTQPFARRFEDLETIRLPQLSSAEQFIVRSSRFWDTYADDSDPELARQLLSPMFAHRDLLGALCPFDSAFHILKRYRLRALEFHDPQCPCLGLDEARLVSGMAHLQRCNARAATRTLTHFVPDWAVRVILAPFARVAACLAARGQDLPLWGEERARFPS